MQPLMLHINPVSIVHKSTASRYRPVSVADGPITARCRFIKNANWEETQKNRVSNFRSFRFLFFL